MTTTRTLTGTVLGASSSSSASSGSSDLLRGSLRRYFTALGNRTSGPVDLLFLGDSITEGARAESSGVGNRWTDRLVAALRARYQPTGVVGGYYIPASPSYASLLPTAWSFAGTTTASGSEGLGYYATFLSSAATATLTFTGTAVRVFYSALSTGSTVAVTIDGTSVASIDSTVGATNYGAYTAYTGLQPGPHTLVITNSGAGQFNLQGAYYFHGDESTGIRMWNGGHSGISSSNFPKFSSAPIAPHLAVIAYGVNDYRLGVNTPAATQANLVSLINGIKAATTPSPSVLVLAMPESTPNSGSTLLGTWASYVSALQTAASVTGAAFVNLETLFADSGIADPALGAIYTDSGPAYVHPTVTGHRLIADYLADLLVPNTKEPAEQLFLAAPLFSAGVGSPNVAVRNNSLVAWEHDAATQEGVVVNFVPPPDWRTVHVDYLWVNDGTGTGNVRWRGDVSVIPDGFVNQASVTGQVAAAAGAQYVAVRTAILTGVAVQPGALHRISVIRVAADATDTLANDAGLVGVVIRRAS